MSYLFMQMLICLLIAGLIGALIGWWLRGGCKSKLRDNDDKWSAKYDADKAIWQGKIDAAEAQIKKGIQRNDNDWNQKLKELESNWEGKVQNLVSDYDSQNSNRYEEIEALKADLRYAREEAEEARLKLSEANSEWSMKLKDSESAWENKIQNIVNDYESKIDGTILEFKALKDKLSQAQERAQKAEDRVLELEDEWSLKLKESELAWESKVLGVKSEQDLKADSRDTEIEALKEELKSVRKEKDQAKLKLTQINDEWNLKFKELESSWESKLQNVMSDHSSNNENRDSELQALKDQLASTKRAEQELINTNDDLNLKLKNAELKWESKLKELKNDQEINKTKADEEIKALRSDLESAREKARKAELELENQKYRYEVKLNDKESVSGNKFQGIMGNYDSKNIKIDEDKSDLDTDLGRSNKSYELIQDHDHRNTEDSYDIEEIEGIGPGYGKKFRKLGINTTKEFAKSYLNNDKAVQKAAKEIGIDTEVIKAWASMADIMSLSGIDGQYAEILQAVGVTSKDDLSKFNAQTLHQKMLKFNSKNSIVPEVPSVELLSKWAIKPDEDGIDDEKSTMLSRDLNECYDIEEVEGIGTGYGKRLRKIGVITTCDLANKFLRDNRATKKAAKKVGVDFDVIRAWASMADLMRIPGIGGQYAEIMQMVGVGSRKELASMNLDTLYKDMKEFNDKKPIVPEIPTVDMLKEWVKNS